jgi:hypothetical protein
MHKNEKRVWEWDGEIIIHFHILFWLDWLHQLFIFMYAMKFYVVITKNNSSFNLLFHHLIYVFLFSLIHANWFLLFTFFSLTASIAIFYFISGSDLFSSHFVRKFFLYIFSSKKVKLINKRRSSLRISVNLDIFTYLCEFFALHLNPLVNRQNATNLWGWNLKNCIKGWTLIFLKYYFLLNFLKTFVKFNKIIF